MIAVLLLSCGGEESLPPPPAPTSSALNMNPSTLELAVFEMTELIGTRWASVEGQGWVDLCFVRSDAVPATATDCSVEQFTMVDGRWFLRVHHGDETSTHRIVMVSPSAGGYSLRLSEGEASFAHADRSAGVVQWTLPGIQGRYRR